MFGFFIGETPLVSQLLHCRLPINYATGESLADCRSIMPQAKARWLIKQGSFTYYFY
jgi:hypothetical protein